MKPADRETGQKTVPDVEDSIPRGIDKLPLDFFHVPLTVIGTWLTILTVRTKAEAAVDTVFEGLKEALAAGERIELRGFGVFSVRARKTGIGRNPRTGTEVSITPGKAVRFKPGKELHTLESGTPAPTA